MSGRRLTRGAASAFVLCATASSTACKTAAPVPEIPAAPPPVVAPPTTTATPDPSAATTPLSPRGDERTLRFDIVDVQETTFTFVSGRASWLRPGLRGIAVDPRRRDALVARFRVLSREGDSARAVITGQASRLTTDNVALVRRPRIGTLRQEVFWAGFFSGAALGAVAAYFATR